MFHFHLSISKYSNLPYKIIADKDREFKYKVQELEHKVRFQDSLTASTSKQGTDSLPRSLPTQTDNQGTGQPSLKNNEICLRVL
ncbi:hypothetical protein IMY05_013G0058000 [Salix suchowensis]|nr:hypothetical protein IMY05_013G0058000 [Salix suchowensis]